MINSVFSTVIVLELVISFVCHFVSDFSLQDQKLSEDELKNLIGEPQDIATCFKRSAYL